MTSSLTGRQMAGAHPRLGMLRGAAALTAAALALAACTSGSPATQEQVARGQELYQANCASCHGGPTGGDIADIPPPHNAEGHTWHHEDCLLVEIIEEGMPRRPGMPENAPTMPAFGDELSDQDIRAILAHIKTWWTEDQLEFQEEVTQQACD